MTPPPSGCEGDSFALSCFSSKVHFYLHPVCQYINDSFLELLQVNYHWSNLTIISRVAEGILKASHKRCLGVFQTKLVPGQVTMYKLLSQHNELDGRDLVTEPILILENPCTLDNNITNAK